MTVRDLIKELKNHPPDAEIGWQDHDMPENELNDRVRYIYHFEPELSFDPAFCENVKVVLRP